MLSIGKIIGKLVKNTSQREIDRLKLIVEKTNDFEPNVKKKQWFLRVCDHTHPVYVF